ncbi:unnamed protein product [Schistosoma margrebowiei]|uniref:Uncharacterized protein n=1 Tax=Schistosoma margrebowiei TaxID=48269 RepID=A0A183M2D4_9TREM|nr:unnamed protein product [Schistosoma margrebowiei]
MQKNKEDQEFRNFRGIKRCSELEFHLYYHANISGSVFRRNSSNLPKLTDDYVDWEETVYLNLLMQYFVYVVTVAVCTRTGPQEWQILKKFSQTVYASPSHRQMNMKGTYEEIFNLVLNMCSKEKHHLFIVVQFSELNGVIMELSLSF